MKKRTVSIAVLLGAALLSTSCLYADSFKDVKANDWYTAPVNQLVGQGGIKGYGDGTFRPSGTITRAEFVSMTLRSMGYTPDTAAGHWSAGAFTKAREIGLLKAGEVNSYVDAPITRNEMALIVSNALAVKKETVPSDYKDYGPGLKDYSSIAGTYQDSVVKAVATGIITGYPDKSFGGSKTLTRAEATVVVVRIIDPKARKTAEKPSENGSIKVGETKPVEQVLTKGMEYIQMPQLALKYKTITLEAQCPYRMSTVINLRGTGISYVVANGDSGGIMVFIKGADMYSRVNGNYWSEKNETSYCVQNQTGSPIDYKAADYIGFADPYEENLIIFPNPFKE